MSDETAAPKLPGLPPIDVNEYGGKKDGERQAMNRRLFMQLLVFDAPPGAQPDALASALADALRTRKIPAVVYADANDPRGLGVLTWAEDPAHFVTRVRPVFVAEPLAKLALRPAYTMLGRTYSTGHEPELAFSLLERPVKNVTEPAYAWHVWYPLRRSGAFAKLDPQEQGTILREHATIGFAYGQAGLATDVRLACHGIDAADNEFVIGVCGRELHSLSHLIQTMRKTRQTSEFIEKMGPFFVGYVLHRVEPAA